MIGTPNASLFPGGDVPGWYSRLWALYRRLSPRQTAYRQIPNAVLVDLAGFCRAHAPAVTEREIGRRDVWLRIAQMRELHDEELAVLRAGLTPEQRRWLYDPAGRTYIEEE